MALDAMKRAYASDEVRELIEFRKKALNDEATRMARARGRAKRRVCGKRPVRQGMDRR